MNSFVRSSLVSLNRSQQYYFEKILKYSVIKDIFVFDINHEETKAGRQDIGVPSRDDLLLRAKRSVFGAAVKLKWKVKLFH